MNFTSRWILMKELQDRARRLFSISREDPEELLPGSDLSDTERRAELERELQRRSEKEAR